VSYASFKSFGAGFSARTDAQLESEAIRTNDANISELSYKMAKLTGMQVVDVHAIFMELASSNDDEFDNIESSLKRVLSIAKLSSNEGIAKRTSGIFKYIRENKEADRKMIQERNRLAAITEAHQALDKLCAEIPPENQSGVYIPFRDRVLTFMDRVLIHGLDSLNGYDDLVSLMLTFGLSFVDKGWIYSDIRFSDTNKAMLIRQGIADKKLKV